VHEIKLDGFRMPARIYNGRVQLLTRTGLDWTDKYPSAVAAARK
jgi:bifunctional non-homologous end joining protein LigD